MINLLYAYRETGKPIQKVRAKRPANANVPRLGMVPSLVSSHYIFCFNHHSGPGG